MASPDTPSVDRTAIDAFLRGSRADDFYLSYDELLRRSFVVPEVRLPGRRAGSASSSGAAGFSKSGDAPPADRAGSDGAGMPPRTGPQAEPLPMPAAGNTASLPGSSLPPSFFIHSPPMPGNTTATLTHDADAFRAKGLPDYVREIDGKRYVNLGQQRLPLTSGAAAPDLWIPFEDAWSRSQAFRQLVVTGAGGETRQMHGLPDGAYAAMEDAARAGRTMDLEAYRRSVEAPPSQQQNQANPDQARFAAQRDTSREPPSAIGIVEGVDPQTYSSPEVRRQAVEGGWSGYDPHVAMSAREAQTRGAQRDGTPDATTSYVAAPSIYEPTIAATATGVGPRAAAVVGAVQFALTAPGLRHQPITTLSASETPDGTPNLPADQALLAAHAVDAALAAHQREAGGRGVVVATGTPNGNGVDGGNDRRDWMVATGPLGVFASRPTIDGYPIDNMQMPGAALYRQAASGAAALTGEEGRLQTTSRGTASYAGSSSIAPKVAAAVDEVRTTPEAPNLPPGLALSALYATADPVGDRQTTNNAGVRFDAQDGFGLMHPHSAEGYDGRQAGGARELVRAMAADPKFRWQDYREEHVFAAGYDAKPVPQAAISPATAAAMQAAESRPGHTYGTTLDNAAVIRFDKPQAVSDLRRGADGRVEGVPASDGSADISVRHARLSLSMEFQLTPEQQEKLKAAGPEDRTKVLAGFAPDFHYVSPAGSAFSMNEARGNLNYRVDEKTGKVQVDGVMGMPQFFGESSGAGQQGQLIVQGQTRDQQFAVRFAAQEQWGPKQGAAYNQFEQPDFKRALAARSPVAAVQTPAAQQTDEQRRLTAALPAIADVEDHFRRTDVSGAIRAESPAMQQAVLQALGTMTRYTEGVRHKVDEGKPIDEGIEQDYKAMLGNLPLPVQNYARERGLTLTPRN